jgi:hypothetical protein
VFVAFHNPDTWSRGMSVRFIAKCDCGGNIVEAGVFVGSEPSPWCESCGKEYVRRVKLIPVARTGFEPEEEPTP